MERVETVKVKGGPKGVRIINKSDFDPKKHELAKPKRTRKAKT